MKKLIRGILICSALLPVVVAPNILSPFLSGKTLALRGILFLISLLTTILFFTDKEFGHSIANRLTSLKKNRLFVSGIVFLGIIGVSTFFAFNRFLAFFSDTVRQEGFLGIASCVVLGFFLILFLTKKDWNRYFKLSLVASVVILCIEFFQAIKGMRRPESLIGNSIFLATHYIFTLFVLGVLISAKQLVTHRSKSMLLVVSWIMIPLTLVGILLTKSRGVLVGLVVGIVVSCIYALSTAPKVKIIRNKITIRTFSIGVIGAILIFSGTLFATRTSTFWTHIPGINRIVAIGANDATTQSRIVIGNATLNAFMQEPFSRKIIGWGQENFIFVWNKYYTPELFSYDSGLFDHAHNKLLDVLLMQGIVGIVGYLGMWIAAFLAIIKSRAGRKIKTVTLFFLTSYFIANLFAFDTLVTYIDLFTVFAFIVSLQNRNE